MPQNSYSLIGYPTTLYQLWQSMVVFENTKKWRRGAVGEMVFELSKTHIEMTGMLHEYRKVDFCVLWNRRITVSLTWPSVNFGYLIQIVLHVT